MTQQEPTGIIGKAKDAAAEVVDEISSAVSGAAPLTPGTPGSGTPSVAEPTEPREPLPPKPAQHGPVPHSPTGAPSADDERSVTVTITDAGRSLITQVLPGHVEVLRQQLFSPLSPTDTQVLSDLLSPVRDHMRAAPPRSAGSRRRR